MESTGPACRGFRGVTGGFPERLHAGFRHGYAVARFPRRTLVVRQNAPDVEETRSDQRERQGRSPGDIRLMRHVVILGARGYPSPYSDYEAWLADWIEAGASWRALVKTEVSRRSQPARHCRSRPLVPPPSSLLLVGALAALVAFTRLTLATDALGVWSAIGSIAALGVPSPRRIQ